MIGFASRPTGSGLLDNKMSTAARSLTKRITNIRTKNQVGFKSRLMPVVVTAAIPNLKYNSTLQIRVRLKSSNSLGEQVIAAGSKMYTVEDKYRACLLPIEPPKMKALAAGSGLVELTTEQQDPAGSHITIFGKFFNKNGASVGPWENLKTFKCKKSNITTLDFSHREYETAAIRAVATNGIGYGSKYSAATVKNWRPINISSNDTIVGAEREMPAVIVVNAGRYAKILVKNAQN